MLSCVTVVSVGRQSSTGRGADVDHECNVLDTRACASSRSPMRRVQYEKAEAMLLLLRMRSFPMLDSISTSEIVYYRALLVQYLSRLASLVSETRMASSSVARRCSTCVTFCEDL
jgi:hypothetical protein